MANKMTLQTVVKKHNPFINSVQMLYKWNVSVATILIIEAIVLVGISVHRNLSITTSYLTTNPLASTASGGSVTAVASRHLFNLDLAYLIAVFLVFSGIFHGLSAGYYRKRYESDLKKRINWLRWIGYGLSLGLMLVTTGLIAGIYDISSLIMIFILGLGLALVGLMVELQGGIASSLSKLSAIIGGLSGAAVLITFIFYIVSSSGFGGKALPRFAYFIFWTMLIVFASLLVNLYLEIKNWKKWSNYFYVERIYIAIIFIAQTALAWQVFAGMLHR